MSQVRIVKHAALCRLMLSALVAAQSAYCSGPYPGGSPAEGIRLANEARKLIRAAIAEARTRGITLAEPVKSPDGTCPTCGGTIG